MTVASRPRIANMAESGDPYNQNADVPAIGLGDELTVITPDYV